jgi:hypothetical protein
MQKGALTMPKLPFTVAVALAAAVATVALSAPASASPPTAASGGLTLTSLNSTFVKQADGNLFFQEHDVADYTGTFTGAHAFDGTLEELEDGSISLHGTATFTGTVDGCGSGTVVFEINAEIDPSGVVTSSHFEALSNQGTLDVHASLEPLGSVGGTLPYAGTYHC